MKRTGIWAGALSCALVIGVLIAGCSAAPQAAGQAAAELPAARSSAINALRKAVGLAESTFPDSPGQWLEVVDSGIDVPPSLLSNLKKVPSSGLSTAEKQVVQEAKDWAAAYSAVDEALDGLTGTSTAIPEDAIQLVALSRITWGGRAFNDHVDQLAARLLKKQTCALGRELIDAATAQLADRTDSGKFSDILDSFLLKIEMQQELTAAWQNPEAYVNLETLSQSILARAKEYAKDYVAVLDSPNGGVRVANLAYLRLCVFT